VDEFAFTSLPIGEPVVEGRSWGAFPDNMRKARAKRTRSQHGRPGSQEEALLAQGAL
jgi:hypothetical protein